jgi:hypothetical protein
MLLCSEHPVSKLYGDIDLGEPINTLIELYRSLSLHSFFK